MPTNPKSEQRILLSEVPDLLPKRNGKKVHYSTVYRWANKGTRGRKLESHLIGGIRYTTLEALERFCSNQGFGVPQSLDTTNEYGNIAAELRDAGL